MKATYRVLGYLIAALVVVQAALIALAVFGLGSWVEGGHDLTKSALESGSTSISGSVGFMLHGMIGEMLIPLLAIVMLVVSFFAKIPGGVKWAGFVVLAVIVQIALAMIAHGVWGVGALHGINAFVLAGLASAAAARATRLMATSTTKAATAPMAEKV
jgi:hypothetical protein